MAESPSSSVCASGGGGAAGRFIVLDGVEGCGKTTQAALLARRLREGGADVVTVRDPGTTRIGERIRQILLDPVHEEMSMRCEMLLYMAARAQMMAEVIVPALAAGRVVVCDRFLSSTLAYQLGGDGLTAEEIRRTGAVAIGNRWPDLTIILDMPVERAFGRMPRLWDRIERRPAEYHERVRRNYLAQARECPEGYRVVDADRPVEEVAEEIWRIVAQTLHVTGERGG